MKTKKIQIKDLATGMKIKTKNEHGDIVFKTVTDKFNTIVNSTDQVRIEFENGVILNCSVNHPIMVLSESGSFDQKKPQELTITDRVLTENGFTSLKDIKVGDTNDETYIDITVEDEHTFFASDSSTGEMVLTHNSQGGIRNASCTIYFPIWHYQFDDLIVLKNNQGTDETRVRHLDYGVVISGLFLRRFKNKENITLFDPNEVPELYEAYYRNITAFDEMYIKYEKRKDLRKKVFTAEEIFKGGVLKERTDTGRIYLMYTDNIQQQGPFDPEVDPIYQSNLCLTGDTLIQVKTDNSEETITLKQFTEQFISGNYTTIAVKSKDVNTNETVWSTVSNAGLTATVTELYEIEDDHGNIIKCTPSHQIYTTNRGWVEAQHLVETDQLVTAL